MFRKKLHTSNKIIKFNRFGNRSGFAYNFFVKTGSESYPFSYAISPRGSHWSGPGSGSTVDFFKNIPDPRKKWSRFSGHSQEDFVNFQWTREIRDSEQAAAAGS